VTEDTLAVDLIKAVGPGGNFLATDHTLKHFKSELFLSDLLDRRSHNERREEEPSLLLERAKESARRILKTHYVPGFKPEAEAKIQMILDRVIAKGHDSKER
jgi:trimethylamine--corrinoid protein Co-methyltransferase